MFLSNKDIKSFKEAAQSLAVTVISIDKISDLLSGAEVVVGDIGDIFLCGKIVGTKETANYIKTITDGHED